LVREGLGFDGDDEGLFVGQDITLKEVGSEEYAHDTKIENSESNLNCELLMT
jgi:hypothetical protein